MNRHARTAGPGPIFAWEMRGVMALAGLVHTFTSCNRNPGVHFPRGRLARKSERFRFGKLN